MAVDDSIRAGMVRLASAIRAVRLPAEAHAADKANPHTVTASQVGLSRVTNNKIYFQAASATDVPSDIQPGDIVIRS